MAGAGSITSDLVSHWYIDLSIPVVAALIGYVTKLVAIRMMFQPLEFVGIRPYLGWQGIVPRRAARMASIAVDTMTRDLISAQDVLSRLDPDLVAKEIATPLRAATAEITREVLAEFQPGLWDALPEPARQSSWPARRRRRRRSSGRCSRTSSPTWTPCSTSSTW